MAHHLSEGAGVIKFAEGFSGIDGFRLGLERAGDFECVWSCDNDKYANKIHRKNYGVDPIHRADDIRNIDPSSIPDHDIFTAGFPCQAFSNAGERQGFKDPRGTLFFEIIRIARTKRPRLLLLENVRGLLSHDEGKTFKTILWELGRLGYCCEWQVLNSLWFGVPQKRQRVFIIGHLGGRPSSTLLPIREIGPMDFGEAQRISKQSFNCIDASFYKGLDKHGQRTVIGVYADRSRNLANKGRQLEGGIKPHFNALTHASKDNIVAIGHTHGHFKNEERHFYPRTYLRTIVAQGGNQRNILLEMLESGYRLRYPTPLECERAQGFPDNWTAGLSKTQRYRLLGNAVTVDVVQFIGERIARAWG